LSLTLTIWLNAGVGIELKEAALSAMEVANMASFPI
jgi:hypothetical protein